MLRGDKFLIIEDTPPQYFELVPPETLQTNNSNGNRFGHNSKRQRMPNLHINQHPHKRPQIKRNQPYQQIYIRRPAHVESSEVRQQQPRK